MKVIISLIGAALLLGTAGCYHPHHYQGGSYGEYPYDHHGYYRTDHRKRTYHSGHYEGRRYYPYDRDGYYHRDPYLYR